MNKALSKKIFLLVACAIFVSCGQSFAQDLAATLLKQGLGLYSTKDYRGAADYLGQVVDMQPNNSQARYYLIYSLTSSGNLELALKHAKILNKQNPGLKQYSVLITQIKKALAVKKTKEINEKRIKSIPQEVILGGYNSKAKMRKPKIGKFHKGPIKPKKLTPLEKAVNEIDYEHYASATRMLNAIIKKSPKNAKAYHYLGIIATNNDDSTEAIKWYKKALKINPKSFETSFMLGAAYYKMGNRAEAEKAYKNALKIKDDVFAMLVLAKIYVHDSRLNEAEKLIKRILKKNSDMIDAVLASAQIKFLKGFTEKAADDINKVLTKEPDYAEAHFLKAKLLVDKDLFEDAADEMKTACDLSPNSLDYKAYYASTLMKSYKVQKGIKVAGDVLAEDPDNIDAMLALAEGFIMSGATGDAYDQIANAESIHKIAKASYLKALMAIKNGDKDKASKYFKEYIQRASGQPKAYMRYAKFLETNGKKKQAAQAYSEISAQFPKTSFAIRAKDELKRLESEGVDASTAPVPKIKKSKYRSGKVKY